MSLRMIMAGSYQGMSPLLSDTLQLWSEAEGKKVLVAKLLSEVSLTDVYRDFEKAHPDLPKERAARDRRAAAGARGGRPAWPS